MDGYWAEGLYGRLLTSDDISWAHMFQGDVATRNIQQAPFIIALKRGHKLTKWLIEEGWGIYFTASTHKAHLLYGNPRINDKRFLPSNEEQLKLGNLTKGPEDPLWKMRRHFRQFSDVYLESENKIVDFRYYDPAILRIYLLSCNNQELMNISGPSNSFYAEDYCEVDSLNHPYNFNIFKYNYLLSSQNLITKCETYCFNLLEKSIGKVSHLGNSTGSVVKNNFFYTIRKEQIHEFESKKFFNFLADLATKLTKKNPNKFYSSNITFEYLLECANQYGAQNTTHEFIDIFFEKYLIKKGIY